MVEVAGLDDLDPGEERNGSVITWRSSGKASSTVTSLSST